MSLTIEWGRTWKMRVTLKYLSSDEVLELKCDFFFL